MNNKMMNNISKVKLLNCFLVILFLNVILIIKAYSNSNVYTYCNTFAISCSQQLESGLINTNIAHRFYGPISDGFDTLYGLDDGANVMLFASYTATDHDLIHIQRVKNEKDWQIGYQRSAQVFSLPLFIMAQLSANWYEDNQTNVFNGVTIFGISWDFSYGQIHSNIGMDHYEEIIGFGTSIIVSISENWDAVIEGFSTAQSNDGALSVGAVYHTFGHRFKLGIHNSTAMGFRQLIQGTDNKDWVFGFQIHRLLEI